MLLSMILLALGSFAEASMPVKVLVPDNDNLQFMSFWLAKGAGYFEDEGLAIELVVPPSPQQTLPWFLQSKADVAVLPPPIYLQLIAQRSHFVLVANLLKNDPIDLIVRRSVFEERKLSATAPIADRLKGLKGLKIGIAPNPPKRLRALFAAYGLDADHDVEMVILHGREQNAGFGDKRVDALYAHTPYLETALVEQDAVMLVNQSAGEIPTLAARQIHALAVTTQYRDGNGPVVAKLVRAIGRAQALVHADRSAAVEALARAFPKVEKRHLSTIVAIYEPAIPSSPAVSADGFQPALALFPAAQTAPDLSGLDLATFVDRSFVDEATAKSSASGWLWKAALAALAVAGIAFAALRRLRPRA